MSENIVDPSPKRQWTEWIDTILKRVINGSLEAIPKGQEIAMLAADVDRIQDYVFESSRLPEIRGASLLLTQLNEDMADTSVSRTIRSILDDYGLNHGDVIIYAAGGSFLAFVPLEVVDEIIQEIEDLYPRETGIATITCISFPVTVEQINYGALAEWSAEKLEALKQQLTASRRTEDWQRVASYYRMADKDTVSQEKINNKTGFGQLVAVASHMLRRAKEEKPFVPFYEALPFAFRCQSCQMRPAAEPVTIADGIKQVCRVCARKQQNRTRIKLRWVKDFEQYLKKDASVALRHRYYSDTLPADVEKANDLSEISQAARAGGSYVGFIYADGNSIGSYMESRRSLQEYREASAKIRKATTMAVYEALAAHLEVSEVKRQTNPGIEERRKVHPFEIVTIGGDDLLVIVPGDAALPVSLHICQAFEGVAPDGLTMSAGVVIAQESNPVRFLRDLAEDLLKNSAKPLTRDIEAATVDFIVLKSQSMVRTSVKQLRAAAPYCISDDQANTKLYLTIRPYTLSQARRMLYLLKLFRRRNFPASQIHALADALKNGRRLSSLFYLYQQARRDDKAKPLEEMMRISGLDFEHNIGPWLAVREGDQLIGYKTPLLDLAELYPFVPNQLTDEAWDRLWREILEDTDVRSR